VTADEVACWREEAFWAYFYAVQSTESQTVASPEVIEAVEEYEAACKAYAAAV
jgi:hypothetical protein